MAFLLKELVFLTIVAMVFSFPWKPYEIVHDPQEDFPLPLNDGTGDSTVDEGPPEKEVDPLGPVGTVTKRALFYDSNDGDAHHFDENKKTRVRRGAVTNSKYLWPGYNTPGDVYIPYVIGGVSSDAKKWLEPFIKELADDTCIKFRPRSGEPGYVKFVSGSGCSSDIGYRPNKIQEVVLGPGCQYKGTIAHEIMHLLGFYHEQTRLDRDQYITVNFANIQNGFEGEFTTRNQNNLGIPYDRKSIMQYTGNSFANSAGGKTMVSKGDANEVLGQLANMNDKDLDKINKLYTCAAKKFKEHTIVLKTKDSWLAGTNGDVYVRFEGTQGKTRWRQITYGGKGGDENERGAQEKHQLPFKDVGAISNVYVALRKPGEGPPANKRSIETAEKRKRFFGSNGWTLEGVRVDGKEYKGGDFYEGDEEKLQPQ
ncbi:hypothetical protein OS493_035718 [Desmophyllum pertusum]|uniref:Metalloendopeptidase n=1 Tax=Desmophyllum pertusum TaxID=174260 RepID=A0A9W9YJW5_9CNID|nr:hypothetical protein OS493_035718 [Desmophyllum pertusum]